MLKRLTDIVFATVGILLLSPLLVVLSVLVAFTSPGGILYRQQRVGRYGRDFTLYKFRTMRPGSDKKGLLTVGARDPRITPVGSFLRRFKLDELPQLFNVLNGTMSLVGPRPEVRKYVDMYSVEQRRVLNVRPGLTDPASIAYFGENELLAKSPDPEAAYVQHVMPAKLALNMGYIDRAGWLQDFRILFFTVARILGFKSGTGITGRRS